MDSKRSKTGVPAQPNNFQHSGNMLADVEEKWREYNKGGVKLGERKICTLAYANNMVLLAEKE